MARHDIHINKNILLGSILPLTILESGALPHISSLIIFSNNRKITITEDRTLVLGYTYIHLTNKS